MIGGLGFGSEDPLSSESSWAATVWLQKEVPRSSSATERSGHVIFVFVFVDLVPFILESVYSRGRRFSACSSAGLRFVLLFAQRVQGAASDIIVVVLGCFVALSPASSAFFCFARKHRKKQTYSKSERRVSPCQKTSALAP